MSWIMELNRTYDNLTNITTRKLLPIAHIQQNSHIEITLNDQAEVVDVRVIEKEDAPTIVPCTMESGGRTSAPAPHALFDYIQYIAGDLDGYSGHYKDHSHDKYMANLKNWITSTNSHPKAKIIYRYLLKNNLISDLIDKNILTISNNILAESWDNSLGEKPALFKVLGASSQEKAFVRFVVNIPGEINESGWNDSTLQSAYTNFYLGQSTTNDLCYGTGEDMPISYNHAKGIRRSGDGAKLISANDASGFTFRGRFITKEEAVSVGYITSEKAHNALKYLIRNQGRTINEKVFLVWGTKNEVLPDIYSNTLDLLGEDGEDDDRGDVTQEEFAKRFGKYIQGFRASIEHSSRVNIMILDAATPGRMSIVFYREMIGNEYIDRIENWHYKTSWNHTYRTKENKTLVFYGAPSLFEIAQANSGFRSTNDVIMKVSMERLFPCITDGAKIPYDIIKNIFIKASNPLSFEKEWWNWEKTLSIACSLIRNERIKEGYDVALDYLSTDRNYLYGRLLALADQIESYAQWSSNQSRQTNAIRYMNAFSKNPFKVWPIIADNILPYQAKLGVKGKKYTDQIDQIGSMFESNSFSGREPLNGLFLLGYYSQRQVFKEELSKFKEQKNTDNEEES